MTLVGDAAHLAVPNGEGANVAMLDGAELGQAIAAHPGDPETAIAEYERVMFARGAAEDDFDLVEHLLGENAPQGLIDMLAEADQAG
ncbi:hypothetical protein GCM10029964_107070 [Kibdelosporangium lantanae]